MLAGGRGWDEEIDAGGRRGARRADRCCGPATCRWTCSPACSAAAELVAYPSLGEGFGLPVLEAMACGAAVLTTRRLSLPEVGGDAVAYTEPDPAAIAAALRDLLDDPDAPARAGRRGPRPGGAVRLAGVRACPPGELRGGRRGPGPRAVRSDGP